MRQLIFLSQSYDEGTLLGTHVGSVLGSNLKVNTLKFMMARSGTGTCAAGAYPKHVSITLDESVLHSCCTTPRQTFRAKSCRATNY